MREQRNTIAGHVSRIFALAILLLVILASPLTAHAAMTRNTNANLRGAVRITATRIYQKTSGSSNVLLRLNYGQKVAIYGYIGNWCYVGIMTDDGKVKGYVPKSALVFYDKSKKHIALTYDDGPSSTNTKTVLDAMEKYGAHCTFFVLGNRINSTTGKLLKRAVSLGCEIGSHSYDHSQLTKLSSTSVKNQFSKTDALVKKYTGSTCTLARAPYGSYNSTVLKAMAKPNIFWSVDTLDWKYRDTSRLISYVNSHAGDGQIILMHDIHATTVKAAASICKNLKAKGYEMMTVSELAAIKGVKLTTGKSYSSIK